MRATSLTQIIMFAGLAGTLSLQPSALQDPEKPAGEFVLEAGEIKVRDLLDRSARYLKRNYLYSESTLANTPDSTIRLQQTLTLDPVACEEVVAELAYAAGISMIPIDEERGIYEWINRFGPKRGEFYTSPCYLDPEQVIARRKLRVYVETTVQLAHLNAALVQNQLRPFFTGGNGAGAGIQVGAAGNSIILRGLAPTVAGAVELIQKIDLTPSAEVIATDRLDQVERRLDALEAKGSDDK